jgi:hypothetical protein
VRRRHASHITVVLSKAAHSGPSVCLRARAPCPLRVSRPGADRAERAAQAAGVSVQCELQFLALPSSLGQDRLRQVMSPDVQLTHGPGRTVALPYSVPHSVYTSLRTVQTHLCLCAKYCGVSRRVRTVSFVDDVAVLVLTRLHFSPDFPRFVSF